MGIVDTLSLFGTVVLAIPIALLGVEFLVGGRTLTGAAFLALGAALVVGQHFLPDPKGEAVDAAAGVVLGDAMEPDDHGGSNDGDDGTAVAEHNASGEDE